VPPAGREKRLRKKLAVVTTRTTKPAAACETLVGNKAASREGGIDDTMRCPESRLPDLSRFRGSEEKDGMAIGSSTRD